LTQQEEILIAPIPTRGRLLVRGLPTACRIKLLDLVGQRIGAWDAAPGTVVLYLSTVPAGTYVLRISGADTMTSRIVPVVH
jgi:hypothetical protein